MARNRDPILAVLLRWLPREGTLLEIASGTGEHAAYFAPAFPGILWQPTDVDDERIASIEAHRALAGAPNLLPARRLDVITDEAPTVDAVFCANMIHASPWETTPALFALAGRALRPGGLLALYGPFRVDGRMVASNVEFEAWLHDRDPRWGVRELREVDALAAAHGLRLAETVEMPSNNLMIAWRRCA